MAISQTAVHEAGHAIACLALGVPFNRVHVGDIWYSNESKMIDMTGRSGSSGCICRSDSTPEKESIIKAAGFMAESIWPNTEFTETKDRNDFFKNPYSADSKGLRGDHHLALDNAARVLRDNCRYLVRLARLLDKQPNHSTFEPEILELCDIWEHPARTPNGGRNRYTRQFKFSDANDVEDHEVPAGCPLVKGASAC